MSRLSSKSANLPSLWLKRLLICLIRNILLRSRLSQRLLQMYRQQWVQSWSYCKRSQHGHQLRKNYLTQASSKRLWNSIKIISVQKYWLKSKSSPDLKASSQLWLPNVMLQLVHFANGYVHLKIIPKHLRLWDQREQDWHMLMSNLLRKKLCWKHWQMNSRYWWQNWILWRKNSMKLIWKSSDSKRACKIFKFSLIEVINLFQDFLEKKLVGKHRSFF